MKKGRMCVSCKIIKQLNRITLRIGVTYRVVRLLETSLFTVIPNFVLTNLINPLNSSILANTV